MMKPLHVLVIAMVLVMADGCCCPQSQACGPAGCEPQKAQQPKKSSQDPNKQGDEQRSKGAQPKQEEQKSAKPNNH